MAYTIVNPGDPIHASQIDQIINSLIGTSGAGQVLSFSALNDSTHYALTVQNLDGTNSNALNVLNSAGSVILQARGTGVTVSALSVTGLTAFQGGVQIGPNVTTFVKPMTNDSSSMLIQSPNYVDVAATGGSGASYLSSDTYYDGTTWQRGLSATAVPTLFGVSNGSFDWYTVPAGSGSMPGWTRRMGLDASGNLTLPTGNLTLSAGGLSVAGNSTFSQNLTVSAAVNAGTVSASSALATANQLQWTADGSYSIVSGNWIYFRSAANGIVVQTVGGSPAQVNCGSVQANGGAITGGPLSVSTGTFSGAITAPSAAFSGNVTVQNSGNNVVPFTVGGVYEHIEHGMSQFNSVGNNVGTNNAISFTRAFNNNPIVVCSIGQVTNGDVQQWHCAAQNISTTGFNARIFNTSGGTGNGQVYWYAMGN